MSGLYDRLHAADPARDRRFQEARHAWLTPRLLPIAALIACVFLAFIPFDVVFAAGHVKALSVARLITAAAVLAIGALSRPPVALPANVVASLIAMAIYAGVFWTRLIVGLHTAYGFTEAIMLIQVGIWFLGGMTFLAALIVNVIGLACFLALESAIGVPARDVGLSGLYLCALGVLSGFAAWHTERLFRRNFADNEELQAQRQEFRSRAMRDALTGLWNHAAMDERVDAARRRSKATGLHGAVLLIDLDRFKPINDRYGHQAGDDALIAVARSIQAVLRPGDSVGRIGGDEFLVLAEDLPNPEFAGDLAGRIRARVESPMRLRLHGESASVETTVGASIGVSLFVGEEVAAADIIDAADAQMYRDKASRRVGAGNR